MVVKTTIYLNADDVANALIQWALKGLPYPVEAAKLATADMSGAEVRIDTSPKGSPAQSNLKPPEGGIQTAVVNPHNGIVGIATNRQTRGSGA